MNFHSILYRELLICSKRTSLYYARSLIAACAGIAALAIVNMTVRGIVAPGDAGRNLLWILAGMGMLLALFEGLLLTVDSIARERREGTLGLLFLSNLNGYDVAIGKAGGAGFRTLFSLMAASPAPALAFLFGGVTLGNYFDVLLTLFNALFFALNLGLFISSLAQNRRHSVTLATALVLWFLFASPAVAAYLHLHGATAAALIIGASPAAPLLALVESGPSSRAVFIALLALSNLLAWTLLFAAGYLLNRNWRISSLKLGPATDVKAESKPAIASGNPILDLARRRGPTLKVFWASCRLAGIAMLAAAIFVPLKSLMWPCAVMLLLLHMILSWNVSSAAAKALAQHRSSGLLELLLTTPLDAHKISSGYLLALKQQAARALAFLVFIGAFLLLLLPLIVSPGQVFLIAIAYGASLLFHLFEMAMNARVALWKGLQSGHTSNAFRRTVGVSGLVSVVVVLFAGVITATLSPSFPKDILLLVGSIAAGISLLAVMAGLMAKATAQMDDDFRAVAALPNERAAK